MPKIKADEQMRDGYAAKIRNFIDGRLTADNAKQAYDALMPYQYDAGGWLLYRAATGILEADACAEFPAEDNMGYFEALDGHGLLRWLETAKFAAKEYEQLPGGYEKLKAHTLDREAPAYREYQGRLYVAALHGITGQLADRKPHLLELFWHRLSDIGGRLEKALPTREELNGKVEREAKKIFDKATPEDLASFHSEAEIKCQIRDILLETAMTDQMVHALYATDDILEGIYRFCTEENESGQIHLAVWACLERSENRYLAEQVYGRAKLAYEDHVEKVKAWPPEKIVQEAYKLTAANDICTCLAPDIPTGLNTWQLKAIYALPDPLWDIYDEWQRCDCDYLDSLKVVIEETADKAMEEAGPEPSGFADTAGWEDEYGDEP